MEGDGVELVLSRAVELRLKISNCIQKATVNTTNVSSVSSKEDKQGKEGKILKEVNPKSLSRDRTSHNEADEQVDEDSERLLHIRDALESLELQLSNLQALHRQHRYEREVALSEIEHSRRMLLDKLKDYKGEDLEVIQEASTFVGETVEHSNDLLLPPYPSRHPPPLVLDNHYQKSMRNWLVTADLKKSQNHSDNKAVNKTCGNSSKGTRGSFIGAAAKTLIITVVGVISVLNFGPRRVPLKILDLFQRPESEEKCPPGRVLVRENGEAHCLVKERVAIPFASAVAKPGVDYGCG